MGSASAKSFRSDLQQCAFFGVHRGFPELLGIHFAKTFVALHVYLARAFSVYGAKQVTPIGNVLPLAFATTMTNGGLVVVGYRLQERTGAPEFRHRQKFDVDVARGVSGIFVDQSSTPNVLRRVPRQFPTSHRAGAAHTLLTFSSFWRSALVSMGKLISESTSTTR